ncbi:hypothetical protein B9Z55_028547 [Caenorhabditis nigoni]|uniref:Uncharacterized protein n=1 Tax=Caenorhabditis nigoni TaxID=1611254 RepID=A0A2G5SB90_9PELO|nr:hypothetical protein B9Z55_028547 [Caenorhabditis nigoni]
MAKNEKGKTTTGDNSKIDSQSEKFKILEKLNSQEQKIDKMAEKLQSMDDSKTKIPPQNHENFSFLLFFSIFFEFSLFFRNFEK